MSRNDIIAGDRGTPGPHLSHGYGRRLLQTLEQEARAQQCHLAILDTYSFQAPDFYQRLGYEVFGVIDGYPRGYQKVFLKKRLA